MALGAAFSWRPPWFDTQMASASVGHCEASLLWLARRKLGAVVVAANADVGMPVVLHRMQYLGGEAV